MVCYIIPSLVSVIDMPIYMQLLETACQPIVSKPKPKVEPPKDESTPKEEEPASEEAAKEGEKMEGEKMEEDPQPTGDNSKTDDMDLD